MAERATFAHRRHRQTSRLSRLEAGTGWLPAESTGAGRIRWNIGSLRSGARGLRICVLSVCLIPLTVLWTNVWSGKATMMRYDDFFKPCVSVASALHPSGVAKSSTSYGWGNNGKVTSAGWQVTLCDPIWHVSSRSGEDSCKLLYSVYLYLYLLPLIYRMGGDLWNGKQWRVTGTTSVYDTIRYEMLF